MDAVRHTIYVYDQDGNQAGFKKDESGQTVQFLVSNDNAALFSVAPSIAANGTLTYTAAANANGVATVSVRLQDSGGTANGGQDTSAVQTFTITVTAESGTMWPSEEASGNSWIQPKSNRLRSANRTRTSMSRSPRRIAVAFWPSRPVASWLETCSTVNPALAARVGSMRTFSSGLPR